MSDALTTIDPNAPPSNPQQFTNKAPAYRSAQFNSLSEGAKNFAKEFLPEDDNQDCIVTFETVSEYKPFKSKVLRDKAEAEGKEPGAECDIYENVVYIRKTVRGNDKLEVHRPMWKSDEREFPYAWQEFKRGTKAAERGTPLSALNIDASVIRSLAAHNVFCVEDMALVTDTWLPSLGTGARDWRKRALDYLRSHKIDTSSAVNELKEMNEKQSAQMAQMLELLQKQSAENEALRAQLEAKPKRGRPPKEIIAE